MWLHHCDPEIKLQPVIWKRPSSLTIKKFKASHSAGKIMGSLFWGSKGVIMLEYLDRGATISDSLYAEQIKKMRNEIRKKQRDNQVKTVLVHQDNASAHRSAVASVGFEILEHPPYSPDYTPSDYYLFSSSKEYLKEQGFKDDDDAVVAAIHEYLGAPDEVFYERNFKLRIMICSVYCAKK
ncbi:Mariner Mos1 transposase [Eumeta japonica]|uniref:Mariner Mos1 transposase n=1 Tax=Eumeta variegata TaxID=151549 RepID=A0A4C1T9C6_EUMVA|nr:Mariner Mos1 transposase [Eumeta japonica]